MPVRDTSLAIYQQIKPDLPRREEQVFRVFQKFYDNNYTDGELSKELELPINCITPRRGSLEKKGLIVDVGRRVCTQTGNVRHCWKLKRQK